MSQSTTSIRPTKIDLNKTEGYLEIVWNDGKTCRYTLTDLREACPCADCRTKSPTRDTDQNNIAYGGAELASSNILNLQPARSYGIENLLPVGNYAIQPIWSDGHQTGIYTWDYLHGLCEALSG
jgi:DUF971 family protein